MNNETMMSEKTQPFEALCREALQWSPDQWKEKISHHSLDEITAMALLASSEYDSVLWKEKTLAILSGLQEKAQLEAVAKGLHLTQIQEILSLAADNHHKDLLNKLSPLFVGMPHFMFRALLIKVNPSQQKILKQEAVTEPIQHHLTLLSHELKAETAAYLTALALKEAEIEKLNPEEIGLSHLNSFFIEIDDLSTEASNLLNEASAGLAIAWNTHRLDIIEQLSRTKEVCQKSLINVIGGSASQQPPSTLWSRLEKRLNSVFEELTESKEIDPLLDEEPAIEALVKFSIWYIRDYWEIGLLPTIDQQEKLELNQEKHSAQECLNHREKLYKMAEDNLSSLGLKTLKDLKQAHIYSKKALIEFIRAKNELLTNI